MKNLSNTLIAIFIMAIVFVSCSQEQDSMSGPLENLYSEMFTLKARYQGIQYDVLCGLIEGDSIKNDSIVFLSNPAFQAIYTSEISNLPNLVTYINNDGFIEYFDTKEAILRSGKIGSAINTNNISEVATRAAGVMSRIKLYDDRNYKDRHLEYVVGLYNIIQKPQLRDEDGFNDKTSSIKLYYRSNDTKYQAKFEGFENDTYQGRSLIMIANTSTPNYCISNLKRIPCGSGNWNDRITSFVYSITEN